MLFPNSNGVGARGHECVYVVLQVINMFPNGDSSGSLLNDGILCIKHTHQKKEGRVFENLTIGRQARYYTTDALKCWAWSQPSCTRSAIVDAQLQVLNPVSRPTLFYGKYPVTFIFSDSYLYSLVNVHSYFSKVVFLLTIFIQNLFFQRCVSSYSCYTKL